jgi:hypothetical protein
MDPTKQWHDDDVATAAEGDGEAADLGRRTLVMYLDKALLSIETSPQEMARIQCIISDLQRYSGVPISAGNTPSMADLFAYKYDQVNGDLQYNICYSVVNTIVARICSFRPRAQFLPDESDYETDELVRELTAASDAWAQKVQYQKVATRWFRDLLSMPGGVLKVYPETVADKVRVEMMCVPPWELKIDPDDDKHGDPECMYHSRWITIEHAIREYGTDEAAVTAIRGGAERLAMVETYRATSERNGVRMVRVVDAYKRWPAGRHVILVGDYIAANEEYRHERHLFERGVFDEAPTGGWGLSALTQIRSIQDRVNDWLSAADDATHLAAKLFIGVPTGAGIDVNQGLTNNPIQIVPHAPGADISLHTVNAVGDMGWWAIIKAMAFEILGVSPNAAHATKAPQVTSAVAIDAVTDIENDRLSQLSQMWEQLCPRVTDLWYAVSTDIGAGGEEYLATDRGSAKVIKFKALKGKPSIRVFPTTLFGNSIPGRLQRAMDVVKAGWFSEEDILFQLDVPDLGPATRQKLAEFNYVQKFADGLLTDKDPYTTPDEWMDPAKMFDYCRKRYLIAVTRDVYPTNGLYKMRKLLDYLKPLANPAPAAPVAPAAPAPLPGLSASPEAAISMPAPGPTQ